MNTPYATPTRLAISLDWDKKAGTLTITAPLTDEEAAAVQASVARPQAKQAIKAAAEKSRASVEMFQTPAERGEVLSVPQMALRVQGELQLFDDPEVLDYPWWLSSYDADPTQQQIEALDGDRVGEGGEIDVDTESGKVTTRFIADLQRDLGLNYRPEHRDDERLAMWLTRNLPETAITHTSKRAFVARWLRAVLDTEGFDLARANRQKFLIRTLLEARVRELWQAAVMAASTPTSYASSMTARRWRSSTEALISVGSRQGRSRRREPVGRVER